MFGNKVTNGPEQYKGLADFLLHAPADEQKKVIKDVAHKSNEDQLKIFQDARMKVKVN